MRHYITQICIAVLLIASAFSVSSQANHYDAKTKLKFGISNDSTNVYITLESYDPETQFQIFRAGMTVILKMAVEPKSTVKISLLPIRVDNIDQFQQGDSYTFLKEKVLLNNPTIEISGLMTNKEAQAMTTNANTPASYQLGWDADNVLKLSFQVKLSDVVDMSCGWQAISKKVNSLIVNVNGIERAVTVAPRTEQRPSSLSQGGFGREGLNPERQFGTPFEESYQTVINETRSFKYKFKLIPQNRDIPHH